MRIFRRWAGRNSEAATSHFLTVIAALGTIMYAVSAARYWSIFRHGRNLLPAAVVACFVLLSEAMIGVAVTGSASGMPVGGNGTA